VLVWPAATWAQEDFIEPPDDGIGPGLAVEPMNEPAPVEGGEAAVRREAAPPDPFRVDKGTTCPPKDAPEDAYVLCAVVESDRFKGYKVYPETGGRLLPNRPLLIWVRHAADRRIKIGYDGELGIFNPETRDLREGRRAELGGRGKRGAEDVTPTVVTRLNLPPAMPGKLTIELRLYEPGTDPDSESLDSLDVTFVVETTYLGTIRLGVAIVGPSALSARYSARQTAAGGQHRIIAEEVNDFETELVIGYAAYLDSNGRPSTGCSWAPFCFSPYFALGVVSPTDEGVDLLTSVHVGAEWEPVDNFSVAATVVGRRVSRLRNGLRIGGAVTEDADLTASRYVLGGAIVFNVSPEFLRFATKGAAGLVR